MEKIEDQEELIQVRRQALRTQMKSLVAGLALTLLAVLVAFLLFRFLA